MVTIQIIVGSTRPQRVGQRVAKWVAAAAKTRSDFKVEVVDLVDYHLPHFDEAVSPKFNPHRQPNPAAQRWLDKLAEADGYIIVTPEYNHSIPGVLKDALDYLDWQFQRKVVAVVGYGVMGGARAAEHLKLIANFLGAAIVPGAVALTRPSETLDEHGQVVVSDRPLHQAVVLQDLLKEVSWWAHTLQSGRDQSLKLADNSLASVR